MRISVPSRRRRQEGAALIEFALIFLPLLMFTIGTLLYGLVFVTQQAMAFAAERGADAIVQVDPSAFSENGSLVDVAGYCAAGQSLATERVNALLPDVGLFTPMVGVAGIPAAPTGASGCEVTVTTSFPLDIPLLPLPATLRGVGFVPVS